MPVKTSRTKIEKPTLAGWDFVEFVSNMHIFCQECRSRDKGMFYRSVRDEGSPIIRTEAICTVCAGKWKQG